MLLTWVAGVCDHISDPIVTQMNSVYLASFRAAEVGMGDALSVNLGRTWAQFRIFGGSPSG
jgi:hypothetical protein